MTKQPRNPSTATDGAWFLETVGAVPAAPNAADALADLTAENDVIDTDAHEDRTPDDVEEHSEDAAVDRDAETEVVEAQTADSDSPTALSESVIEPEGPKTPDAEASNPGPAHGSNAVQPSIKTTQITFSSFDGDPGTANLTYARPGRLRPAATPTPAPTAIPTAPLPATTRTEPLTAPLTEAPSAEPEPSAVAVDDGLARQVRTKRSFRWPIAIFLLVGLGLLAVAAVWLPQATRSEALAVRQTYYDATAAVRNQLPDAQQALDVITNPESSAAALSDTIPTIAQFGSAAFDMQEAAAEPLPTALPFVPTGDIDALVPLKDRTALLGEKGSALAQELGAGYIYRVSIPDLLNPGNLPVAADTQTINTISITLTASLTADAAIVAALPDDESFATTHELALSTHQRYGVWQREYLAALTGEDTDTARTLLDELDAMRTSLLDANAADLAAFRGSADTEIVGYAGELETLMTDLINTG